jgi:hypothetical protein
MVLAAVIEVEGSDTVEFLRFYHRRPWICLSKKVVFRFTVKQSWEVILMFKQTWEILSRILGKHFKNCLVCTGSLAKKDS